MEGKISGKPIDHENNCHAESKVIMPSIAGIFFLKYIIQSEFFNNKIIIRYFSTYANRIIN